MLAASLTVLASSPSFAGFWHCVPEIDGSAAVSVTALLACVGAIVYNKLAR
jgi:hypothetical protein